MTQTVTPASSSRWRLWFVAGSVILWMLFNLAYCSQFRALRMSEFDSWYGQFRGRPSNEPFEIALSAPSHSIDWRLPAKDPELREHGLRLLEIAHEAQVFDRADGEITVSLKVGTRAFTGRFALADANTSPPLQTFLKLFEAYRQPA